MNTTLIQKAKNKFLAMIEKNGEDPWDLIVHIEEAEKWARKMLERYPEADEDVVLLTVWLHDIGHYPTIEEDHAVVSERVAKQFFEEEKADKGLVNKTLHCVRSHRNRDVKPDSLEAKLFAMIDSISHFTYLPFMKMVREGRSKYAMEKLERDYRDIAAFPEVLEEIAPLYHSLKKMLIELDKVCKDINGDLVVTEKTGPHRY